MVCGGSSSANGAASTTFSSVPLELRMLDSRSPLHPLQGKCHGGRGVAPSLLLERNKKRRCTAHISGMGLRMQEQSGSTGGGGGEAQASVPPIMWDEKEGLKLFGVKATPEVWAIALVYFVQGILGIASLAKTFYLKDTLHLGPAEMQLISSITILPWVIKPLYGFLSDTYPLFGYKRRSYLILSGLVGSASWGALSVLSGCVGSGTCPAGMTAVTGTVALTTIASLGVAFSDVLVDAIVVAKSRGGDQGKAGALQSLCWSSVSIGGLLSAYFSGSFVEDFGPTFVFALTAVFPLITAGVSLLIDEKPVAKAAAPAAVVAAGSGQGVPVGDGLASAAAQGGGGGEEEGGIATIKRQFGALWSAFSDKAVLLPVLFLVAWQGTPSSGSALFFFETNELGFKPEFLGRLSLISSISSLAGIVAYDQYLKKIPLKVLFKWVCITGVVLGMTPLILVTHLNRAIGLPDTWFAIGDDVILTVLGQIGFMPVLVLGASLCPPGIEATLYAALMSVNNLSGGLGQFMGGIATKLAGVTETDYSNLPLLIALTNLSGLVALPLLGLLPEQELNEEGELVIVRNEEVVADSAGVVDKESEKDKAPLA